MRSINPIKWFWHILVGQFQLGIVGASGGSETTDTEQELQRLINSLSTTRTSEAGSTTGTATTGLAGPVEEALNAGYGDYATLIGATPSADIIGQGTQDIAAGRELLPGALSAYERALSSGDVANDPQLQAAINAAINPIQQRLTQDILPGLKDQEVMAGAVGGTGGDVAESLALQDFMRQAGDISSGMTYDALQAGKNREFQAAQGINELIGGLGSGAGAQFGLAGAGSQVLQDYLRTLQADPRRRQQQEEQRRLEQEQQQQTQEQTTGKQTGTSETSGWNLGLKFGG